MCAHAYVCNDSETGCVYQREREKREKLEKEEPKVELGESKRSRVGLQVSEVRLTLTQHAWTVNITRYLKSYLEKYDASLHFIAYLSAVSKSAASEAMLISV